MPVVCQWWHWFGLNPTSVVAESSETVNPVRGWSRWKKEVDVQKGNSIETYQFPNCLYYFNCGKSSILPKFSKRQHCVISGTTTLVRPITLFFAASPTSYYSRRLVTLFFTTYFIFKTMILLYFIIHVVHNVIPSLNPPSKIYLWSNFKEHA